MKVFVNHKEKEIAKETKISEILEEIRAKDKNQATTKTLIKTTGQHNIFLTLNNKLINLSKDYDMVLKEGDHIKSFHPGFGG